IIKKSLITTAKIDILLKEKTEKLQKKLGILDKILEKKPSLVSMLNASKERFSIDSCGTTSVNNQNTYLLPANNDLIRIINMEEETKGNSSNNRNQNHLYTDLPPIMEENYAKTNYEATNKASNSQLT